jgi:hypothetical protein
MPSWWPFWKSAVQRKAEEWEQRAAESGAVDGLFRRLGTDLNEEARVKAMAIARSQYDKQPEGGWISKTGRKHVEGFFEALFNLFVPGQVNLFMQLALLSSLAHVTLLGSWVLSELTEGTSEGTYVNDLFDAAMSTATAISPTRADDFPEWYQQAVRAADLLLGMDQWGGNWISRFRAQEAAKTEA